MLIGSGEHQTVLDEFQKVLGSGRNWRIALMPVEAAILSREKQAAEDAQREETASVRHFASEMSREELYRDLDRGTRPDLVFVVLTVLSTVVAAIGLLYDNIAVVIGAMVIAPLLGPNLAFAFASATADRKLVADAVKANAVGIGVTLALSIGIGLAWTGGLDSRELLTRTEVGYGSVVLALASGAAAVLSISSGISAALVGVMVAVALLPPAATLGIMLGAGEWTLARGALLLLVVNIVSVNLAAQLIFMIGGLRPRTWFEQQSSRRQVVANIVVWLVLLAIAIGVIA